MKYFIDTEFIESGRHLPIQLISIGIVCEDGRTLYAVSAEFDESSASEWVKANVLPFVGDSPRLAIREIANQVVQFVSDDSPEFWGYFADYDWVVFCQLFGTMMDLPQGFPMYCRDLKQWCDQLGNPRLPQQSTREHCALDDALWNQQCWEFLNQWAESGR